MQDFWEKAFKDKQEMWGNKMANSANIVYQILSSFGVSNLLIPGIGYGRNAQIFVDNNIKIIGIEISKTTIEIA